MEEPEVVIKLDKWEDIRLRCVRDGEPIKVVARDLDMSRNTVRKYVRSLQAPEGKARRRGGKLDLYESHIDAWIRASPKITAVRIGTLLREEVDATLLVSEARLRVFVAKRRARLVPKEAFIRAVYVPADQAQFDFTPVDVLLNGVPTRVELFVLRLSYSARLFARAARRCDQLALFVGLLDGFVHFGGLPREAIFDNATTAVTRVLRGRLRNENREFAAFRGALALDVQFAAPAKGNEKGGVEGSNFLLQNNFFTPVPAFDSLDDLNAALLVFCDQDLKRVHSGHRETVGMRFTREAAQLRPLPFPLPRASHLRAAHVNKFAEVSFEGNRYSVPTRYAHRDVLIEIFEHRLHVILDDAVVAEHGRLWGKDLSSFDIRHYIDLLTHKHRAAVHALVLSDGRLPAVFTSLLDHYVADNRNTASKRWMSIVALLSEHAVEEVSAAITRAIACGTEDPAAIMLLLRQQHAVNSPLDLASHPSIPQQTLMPVDLSPYTLTTLAERES
jgi:transposase